MDELASAVIQELKSQCGRGVRNFEVAEERDSPLPWLTLNFVAYDFLPIAFLYDRGHFGFNVDFGTRRVSIAVETPEAGLRSREDLAAVVASFDHAVRLRIPDKFLEESGWGGREG